MKYKTNRIVLFIEIDDEFHQALLTKSQVQAVKAILEALPDTIQLMSTPINFE